MSGLEENRLIVSPSRSAEFRRLKEHVEERLEDAGVRVARSVSLPHGSKKTKTSNHEQATTQEHPSEIYGNYTIHGGDGLVILDIDVDDSSELPEWVASLPETFAVQTVHDGLHLYYTVEDDSGISNAGSPSWGSVRYNGWYGVGPGSAVDHDSECGGCGKTGLTPYQVVRDCPIATLSGVDLDNLRDVCQSEEDDTTGETSSASTGADSDAGITKPDEEFTDEAEEYICAEFVPRYTTELAGSDLMDSLRGGTGSYHLRRDDDPDSIDRSDADYYVLEWLYGAFLFRGDDSDTARERALAVFKRYCLENRYDKTGNKRKWLQKGDSYLTGEGVDWDGVMDAVQDEFDFGAWHRWRRRQYEEGFDPDEHRPWTDPSKDGEPSLVTKDTVRAAVSILARDVDPERAGEQYGLDISSLYASEDDLSSDSTTIYCSSCREICTPPRACSCGDTSRSNSREYPTASEVGELAVALNPDREKSYFEETLKQLQRETGEFARAVCNSRENSQRHVYFPYMMEPPEDADEVHRNGEEYEPESYPEKRRDDSEDSDQTLLTDGGTDLRVPSQPRPMSEDGTEDLKIKNLTHHPKAKDRYPADDQRELDLSGGQREPIKVTRDSAYTDAGPVIIDGHRRVDALSEAGESTVEAQDVGPFESQAEEMRAVLEYNEYRSKTPGEKVIDAVDWIRVQENSVDTSVDNFPSGYRDELDNAPGDTSGKSLVRGLRVWWAAKEGEYKGDKLTDEAHRAAEDLWEGLRSGDESFHSAYTTLKDDLSIAVPGTTKREHEEWMVGESIFPYIGSKEEIVGWFLWRVPEYGHLDNPKRYTRLPEHSRFVEVFGGTAAGIYNKPPSEEEVYNDLNEDYSDFFETLRDHGEEIEKFLETVQYTRDQFEEWTRKWYQESWRPNDDVERAGVFFFNRFAQMLAKEHELSGFKRPSQNRPQSKEFYDKVEDLGKFQKRFKRDNPEYFEDRFDLSVAPRLDSEVEVENLDYREVLSKYDSGDTLFYLDPPYVDKEGYYNDEIDHDRLVREVSQLEGEFILSYGEHLPDGLEKYRIEELVHPTSNNDRLERLIFSFSPEEEGTFDIPTTGDPADEW